MLSPLWWSPAKHADVLALQGGNMHEPADQAAGVRHAHCDGLLGEGPVLRGSIAQTCVGSAEESCYQQILRRLWNAPS